MNVEMLKEEEIHERYIMQLAQCYGQWNSLAGVEGGWKEFQGTVAQESLQGRPQLTRYGYNRTPWSLWRRRDWHLHIGKKTG